MERLKGDLAMKLSEMLEPKKPSNGKTNKMSYDVFMGIVFLVCCFVQCVLFEIIQHVYGLPETNSFLDTCALLLAFLCLSTALLCFAGRLSENNLKAAIVLLIVAGIFAFFAILFTVIGVTEAFNG